MAENQIQVPLPPVPNEEEEERRGGGIFFWLTSMPVRVAFLTAVVMFAFLVIRDFLVNGHVGNPRLDATRNEMARPGSLSGSLREADRSDADDPFDLGDRPPPRLPPESSGLVGSVSTGDLKKGRHSWGGLRPETEKQRSSARSGRARYDKNGDPVVGEIQGQEIAGGSIGGRSGSGRGDGGGGGIGRMDNKERNSKSLMRGWAMKRGKGGTKLELGNSKALDKLKGMEATMKSYADRKGESAGSAHKKMWDAASFTDWKLQAKTSLGQSSVRDYKIGGKAAARKKIEDEGEGGPLASSAAKLEQDRRDGSSGKNFTTEETAEEEFQPQTGAVGGGDLLPLASQALLQSTGLNASELPNSIGAAQQMGAANAGGLMGLSGVGMMATGQTVQGASMAGLGAIIAAQGY